MLKRSLNFVIAIMMLAALSASFASGSPKALAQADAPSVYSCGTPTVFHCHGIVGFQGGTIGAYTRASIRPIEQTCCTGDFMRNKLWLAGGPGNSFIEVGYGTQTSGQNTFNEYFWADRRPAYQVYWLHDIAVVDPAHYDFYGHFQILKNGASSYSVEITVANVYYPNLSTDNTMSAGYIDIGTQLSGTDGAHMNGVTQWFDNQWFVTGGKPRYQTSSGPLSTNNGPLSRSWAVPPAPGGTGGEFRTSCPGC